MIAEPPLLMVPRPAWSRITAEFELPVSIPPPTLPWRFDRRRVRLIDPVPARSIAVERSWSRRAGIPKAAVVDR